MGDHGDKINGMLCNKGIDPRFDGRFIIDRQRIVFQSREFLQQIFNGGQAQSDTVVVGFGIDAQEVYPGIAFFGNGDDLLEGLAAIFLKVRNEHDVLEGKV